jgi:3,4-dihydroxy 2-butanone 4-phosphate synthase/GTP cyclohydrolase II
MARMPDLVKFSQLHGLKIATIEDLIAYRRRTEKLIHRSAETKLVSRFGGEWKLYIYRANIGSVEHLALVQGDVSGDDPILVRVQQFNILTDALGDVTPGAVFGGDAGARSGELQASMRRIAEEGRGIVVLIRELLPDILSRTVSDRQNGPPKTDRVADLRQHGIGAQILLDLGVKQMVLLSNTKRAIVGLEGYGLHVAGQEPIVIDPPLPA